MSAPTVTGAFYRGMFRFDPAALTWTLLASPGSRPGPRHMQGMVAARDGLIYVFGGYAIIFPADGSPFGGV